MVTARSTTSSVEPVAGIQNQDTLHPPELVQQPRGIPSVHYSEGSSLTATNQPVYKLVPTATIKRYGRSMKLENKFEEPILPALTTCFKSDEPRDWIPLIHPEGALYWVYRPEGGPWDMPVFTDAYLYDVRSLEEIERFREDIFAVAKTKALPPKWELVLDVEESKYANERICYYYFVNTANRSLFWLEDFNVTPLLWGLCHAKSMSRIHQALESYYWCHWEMFPHDREVSEELLRELMGVMMHAGFDEMTSNGSTSVYSEDELRKLIHFVKRIKFVGGKGGYSACVIGRSMRFFTQGRFINFHGQHGARLSAHQSVFEGQRERTWLIKTLSFLLFFAPEVHLKALDSVYTDFIVCHHKWGKFFNKVQNEWRELCRIGTVLLTANVAFLAIPTVDRGDRVRSPAQVTSFMSAIFSIGCVVIAQFLLRHHTIRPKDTAEEVDEYLRSHHDLNRGLETLAILYSLPYSLLLWALMWFFVAFVFVTLVDSKGKWQRYPTAAVMSVFVALLVWCVWTTWEGKTTFIGHFRRFAARPKTRGDGEISPQSDKTRAERPNGPESPPLGSIQIHETDA